MPVERLRLRPWLKKMIDSGAAPGLQWVDRDKKIFKVAWKHASRHGWSLDTDAILFQSWAEHTGRFRLGLDKPDPRRWKANFRCALNALPDIVEIPSQGQTRGRDAFKVYRMCERTDKKPQDNNNRLQTKRVNTSPTSRAAKKSEEDKEPIKERVNKPFYAFPKPPYENNPFFGYTGFPGYCVTAFQSFAHLPRDHDYVSPYYDQGGRPEMKDIGVMTYPGPFPAIKQEPLSPVGLMNSSCPKTFEQGRLSHVVENEMEIAVKEEEESIPSDQEIIDLVDQLSQGSGSPSSYDDMDEMSQSVPGSPVSSCSKPSPQGPTFTMKTEEQVPPYSTSYYTHSSLGTMSHGSTMVML